VQFKLKNLFQWSYHHSAWTNDWVFVFQRARSKRGFRTGKSGTNVHYCFFWLCTVLLNF